MQDSISAQNKLRDIRDMDVFAESRNHQARCDDSSVAVEPSTEVICRTILFATDVLRRTILAVHDVQQASREYDP